ncbi:MAG: SDR family NAD(P)-dependent oxidoreductase [Bryobacteraceae bacterium]|nr:SDR family NAD(P)-dependent oxidoreductase [Bryobacteraceae bacterium]
MFSLSGDPRPNYREAPLIRYDVAFAKLTPPMQTEGKVILITGASEGIGAACARLFRARGARICLTARSEDKLRTLAGPRDLVIPANLTEPGAPARIVETALSHFGTIDVLINNAGAGLYTPAHSGTDADARRLFDLNVFAPLDLIRNVAPHMKRRGSGSVVNISSIAGMVALPWFTMYSATKAAMISMTNGLRIELRNSGIHCMTVCPGYVRTNFQHNLLAGTVPPALGPMKQRWSISADQCAVAVLRGIDRQARTVVTPASGWLLVAAASMFPRLVDRQLESIWLRESRQSEESQP